MRIFHLFLITVFVCLLGGIHCAHAGSRVAAMHHSAQVTNEEHEYTQHTDNPDFAILKSNDSNDENDFFFSEEDDSEDTSLARKYELLTKCFFTLSYALILFCLYRVLKNRLPQARHLSYIGSYKYITQRVLRL